MQGTSLNGWHRCLLIKCGGTAIGSLDDETERARAEELVAKKLRTMGGLDPQVQARRLAAMLARKGYPSGVAYAVVRDAVNAAVEHHQD